MTSQTKYRKLMESLPAQVSLVAVSKIRTPEEIKVLYNEGHRDFGENYVQELLEKKDALPDDIRWHFIGHLQSNKVKYIAPFVHLIHGVDRLRLLAEINRQGKKINRKINVLLQVHVAMEETKFGLDVDELDQLITQVQQEADAFQHIFIKGIMGMASFTDNEAQVREEFQLLKSLFEKYTAIQTSSIQFEHLSMGMSGDYSIAIEEGSNMVRIGSLLFGPRN